LGKCYAAPATGKDTSRPTIEVKSRRPIVLARIAAGGARTFDEYRKQGGGRGLEKALSLSSEEVVAEVEQSELAGRGGAGFPTGKKWRSVAAMHSTEKYVVANLDEGDPGAYIDRFIAEDDPFCLIEGMAIAARAVSAKRGWVYARCEYPEAIRIVRDALDEARNAKFLGSGILGSDFAFDIELVIGGGSYICGEETSLLNSIEGKRPLARIRPPYVAESGLWGKPTLVNNAETFANVPWIIEHGGASYSALGVLGSRGNKLVSLNSLFRKPGLYEVEFGIPLREIVEDIGGGLRSGSLRGLIIGGPIAGMVPPSLLDTKFGFTELREIGASVGHGGIVAFDEHTSIPELVHHVFSFGTYESCGECTPCRLGSARIEKLWNRVPSGTKLGESEQLEWRQIVDALRAASLCGLGTGLAEFAESIGRYYPEELSRCFA
jgi:NADH:ubiquinone oxidoreductase subunit F (NADH-binding)